MQQFPIETPQPKAASPSLLSPWNNRILSLFLRFHWREYGQCGIDWLTQTRDIDFLSFTIQNKKDQNNSNNTNTENAHSIWQLSVHVAQQVDELRIIKFDQIVVSQGMDANFLELLTFLIGLQCHCPSFPLCLQMLFQGQ